MKIAVTADGDTLKDVVSDEFEKSKYVFIVEMDDLSYTHYANNQHIDPLGIEMAKKIIDCDCEGIITGSIEEKAFDELAIAQVTRYFGAKHSVEEVLELMEGRKLDLIRDYKGGNGNHHHHDTCECGENETPLEDK
jgi:predicted Fe-Mo cluster-binding NifX family protein